MHATSLAWAGSLCTLALAQRLDKPPLETDLEYLQKGLMEHLSPVNSSYKPWPPGWIPAHCKTMTEDPRFSAAVQGNTSLSAADVETFNVTYDDCDDAWILCRHKDSPAPLENMIDLFGRVPVLARQYVRHIINLPNPSVLPAYNWGGNIAIFGPINGDLTVFIHETGHSLDLLGAYGGQQLYTSETWLTQFANDSYVPDEFSQVSQVENLAQNTVVATYDLNVPGGFGAVEPRWAEVLHQYNTIMVEQKKAGGLLVKGGVCGLRLANSNAVAVGGNSTVGARGLEGAPDVRLSDAVDVIEPVEFDTMEHCKPNFRA